MIGRLSNIITAVKAFLYRRRALCYLAILLGLLLYGVYGEQSETAFVYSVF